MTTAALFLLAVSACGSAAAPHSPSTPPLRANARPPRAEARPPGSPHDDAPGQPEAPPEEPPPVERVLRGRVRAEGSLAERAVWERLRAAQPEVIRCVPPDEEASLTVTFDIHPDGSPNDLRVDGANDTVAGVCVATVFDALSFAAAAGTTRVQLHLHVLAAGDPGDPAENW